MNIITTSFDGIPVSFTDAAYLHATKIAAKFQKQAKDYLRNERTTSYMAALDKYLNPVRRNRLTKQNQLVIIKQGGKPQEQGTWLHPKLAIDFARWLSPEFAVWCDGQIETILHPQKPRLSAPSTVTDRAPLKVAVNKLAAAAHIKFRDAYTMVHQHFAIKSVEELTVGQIPEAVEYVHALILSCGGLSGELLPKESKEEEGQFILLDTLKNIEMWRMVGYNSYRAQINALRTLEAKLDECRYLLDSARRNAAHFYDSVTECRRIPLSAEDKKYCAERASLISAK